MPCKHEACTCRTAFGAEYCSPSCESAADPNAAGCACGHGQCEASPTDSRQVDGDVFDPHTVAESMTAPNTTTEYDGRP